MTFMYFSFCFSFHWPLIFDFFYLSNIYSTCPELAYSLSAAVFLALCPSSLSVLLVFGRWTDALEWVSERARKLKRLLYCQHKLTPHKWLIHMQKNKRDVQAHRHKSWQATHHPAGRGKERWGEGVKMGRCVIEQENRGQINFGTNLYVFGALRRRIEVSWWNEYYWGKERTAWIAL